MKKFLKLITILGLAACCLLAATGCNLANEFAGEYEWKSYGGVGIVDTDEEDKTNEMKSDANLTKAVDDIKTMIGTKIELTAGYVLFKDSDTKFNVARYDLGSLGTGNYEIATNDEKLIIRILIYKSSYEERDIMQVYITSFTTALDGKDYYCSTIIQFEKGENK